MVGVIWFSLFLCILGWYTFHYNFHGKIRSGSSFPAVQQNPAGTNQIGIFMVQSGISMKLNTCEAT